ncbi:hypothetical protein [Stenotrophomonas maltophilia]|uniref:hypothetical protein n=1 Tax=Stenotrophomonas maltophilia TaxID=40324 RepID=UPI0012B11358|nr:hypothetical protein [Stenotrophomonas maltophilia]QGL70065.1 hypothetical protein FEO85_00680 [Stenotrophomonas maltophilia]
MLIVEPLQRRHHQRSCAAAERSHPRIGHADVVILSSADPTHKFRDQHPIRIILSSPIQNWTKMVGKKITIGTGLWNESIKTTQERPHRHKRKKHRIGI